jgi:hypothetical protein
VNANTLHDILLISLLSISRHHQRQGAIKGKQKISDLISGELPNDIIKVIKSMNEIAFAVRCVYMLIVNFQASRKLVDSSEKLKHHIKPHLSVPKYSKLKDSSKLSSIKINNMMSDLVGFINELVDDQIQMRSCIPLTPELRDFYGKLMGRKVDDVEGDVEDDVGERYEKSVERFLTPRKRFTRKVVSFI